MTTMLFIMWVDDTEVFPLNGSACLWIVPIVASSGCLKWWVLQHGKHKASVTWYYHCICPLWLMGRWQWMANLTGNLSQQRLHHQPCVLHLGCNCVSSALPFALMQPAFSSPLLISSLAIMTFVNLRSVFCLTKQNASVSYRCCR